MADEDGIAECKEYILEGKCASTPDNGRDVKKRKTRSEASIDSLEALCERLRGSKKIVIVSGAGISVSCGIPDFRSKEGLYNTLDCAKFGIPSAELIFDYEFFKIDPDPFYRFSSVLLPKASLKPSPSHHFIHGLDIRKKLMRCYTQNIDGIERRMGLNRKRLIECHGSLETFRCTSAKCNKKCKLAKVRGYVERGEVPYCTCKGNGVLKPDITFFGEGLPDTFMNSLNDSLLDADMVIVMGTSLKVGGSVHEVLRMIGQATEKVPFVLLNRDPVFLPACVSRGFDASLLGQCDDLCAYLAMKCFSSLSTSTSVDGAPEDEGAEKDKEDHHDSFFRGLHEDDFKVTDLGSMSPFRQRSDEDADDLASRARRSAERSWSIARVSSKGSERQEGDGGATAASARAAAAAMPLPAPQPTKTARGTKRGRGRPRKEVL